jgi:hypothetical protein
MCDDDCELELLYADARISRGVSTMGSPINPNSENNMDLLEERKEKRK